MTASDFCAARYIILLPGGGHPHMKRRFITLVGGAAAAWPLAARAQSSNRMRRIGVLIGGATQGNEEARARVAAFEQGL
jgi:putative ABC transport system substrate-binding protein